MTFKFFSQFFTEAYQDRNIINDIFIQKYFMNEKFNLYNKKLKKQDKSFNFEQILNISHNHEEQLKDNYRNRIKTIEFKGNILQKNNNYNTKSLIINSKEKNNFPSTKNKLPIPFNSNHQYNFFPNTNQINNIDNSCSKFPLRRHYNSTFNLNKKNNQLNHLKGYMKKEFINDDINEKQNPYESRHFKFPYYLYLLNIFNKTFGIEMRCVNNRFRNAWKYMIDVFDVIKFIELQTNVDLIKKILFELIIEENNPENNSINMIVNNISNNK